MAVKRIVDGVYAVGIKIVNAFLIDCGGLTLVDTGVAGSEQAILAAVQELGRQPTDVHHILVTHLHTDHVGSLAALKQATGAQVVMHAADAALVRQGIAGRDAQPAPGLFNSLVYRLFIRGGAGQARVNAVETDCEVTDGQLLPIAGGVLAVHTPGHTAGHTVFVWQKGGVAFAGDALSHMTKLGYGILYEDLREGQRSICKLANLEYDTLCFGHGKPIIGQAAQTLRKSPLVQALAAG